MGCADARTGTRPAGGARSCASATPLRLPRFLRRSHAASAAPGTRSLSRRQPAQLERPTEDPGLHGSGWSAAMAAEAEAVLVEVVLSSCDASAPLRRARLLRRCCPRTALGSHRLRYERCRSL